MVRLLVNVGSLWLLALAAFLFWWAHREPRWLRDRDDAFFSASRAATGMSSAVMTTAGATQTASNHHNPAATRPTLGSRPTL